jgi:hypothetical protein
VNFGKGYFVKYGRLACSRISTRILLLFPPKKKQFFQQTAKP